MTLTKLAVMSDSQSGRGNSALGAHMMSLFLSVELSMSEGRRRVVLFAAYCYVAMGTSLKGL